MHPTCSFLLLPCTGKSKMNEREQQHKELVLFAYFAEIAESPDFLTAKT